MKAIGFGIFPRFYAVLPNSSPGILSVHGFFSDCGKRNYKCCGTVSQFFSVNFYKRSLSKGGVNGMCILCKKKSISALSKALSPPKSPAITLAPSVAKPIKFLTESHA